MEESNPDSISNILSDRLERILWKYVQWVQIETVRLVVDDFQSGLMNTIEVG